MQNPLAAVSAWIGRVRNSAVGAYRGALQGAFRGAFQHETDPDEAQARRLANRYDRQRETAYRSNGGIPTEARYAARYGVGGTFWSRRDEALRDSWASALAMRRSAFIHELLRHRQLASISLPWEIKVDDDKDPTQAAIAALLTKLVEAIPRFQELRLWLKEDIWYGHSGVQVTWGKVSVDGKVYISIVEHEPVHGDSIQYRYDKIPGVLVRTDWSPPDEPGKAWIQQTDRGRALFLGDRAWRDKFIISRFEPAATDFYYESDLAGSNMGLGLRGRIHGDFRLRENLRGALVDALWRVGVNGMLVGHFQMGNQEQEDKVIDALLSLSKNNITALPVAAGQTPSDIQHIEVAQVGYDILQSQIDKIEDTIRRCFLGQTLSTEAQGTGLGSGMSDLHESMFENIVRYDATSLAEILTKELLGPLIRQNTWVVNGQTYQGELPFRVRFEFRIDKADVQERIQALNCAYEMGLPLGSDLVYESLGLTAPKDGEKTVVKPDPSAMPPGTPGMPGAPGPAPMGPDGKPLRGAEFIRQKAPEGLKQRPIGTMPKFNAFKGGNGKLTLRPKMDVKPGAPDGQAPAKQAA